MKATVRYPASIGEIIQGRYKGKDILLSCPINLYTEVTLSYSDVKLFQEKYGKSYKFIENLLNGWGYKDLYFNISVNSNIPKGKGFASSTADLCATYKALLKLTEREFNEDELIKNCLIIEPTDSIVFDKATIFDYKKGEVKEEIGDYLKFYVLCFVGEKVIDTVEYNKNNIQPLSDVDDLVLELKDSIMKRDIKKLACISTESISRNQHRLKYEILDEVLELNKKLGGLGIIGGHSGDILGIVFSDIKGINSELIDIVNIKGYKKIIVETLNNISSL